MMSTADLSIKRPIFVTCLALLLVVLGMLSIRNIPVDLFPNVTFPIVIVNTVYPGAGPEEVETLISKVMEEEMSTLPGIKSLRSINKDGLSTVVAEFSLETDVKFAEQQIRDRASSAKRKMPKDIQEPVIRRLDPADQPVVIASVSADLPETELYQLVDETIKPKIEQVSQVGLVEIIGGRKREIHVELDRNKLKKLEISASQVVNRIGASGQNIPVGSVNEGDKQTVFRTLGEYRKKEDIEKTIVNFIGNDVPITVRQLGNVVDSVADEKSKSFVNGKQSILLMIFRQSGSNTIAVVDSVKKRLDQLSAEVKPLKGSPELTMVRDGAWPIRANVDDVKESILIGFILTILVVYLFLGSGRSTFITGLAIPNSLIGAFFLMSLAGFTINLMSLLALSLAVGLLIDDAIVVRENIFRHVEMGKKPIDAALIGTKEVTLAVLATTLAVLSVFGPIGFLKGIVGQFFKEFGLTVCFAMVISLFDALTIAPMLSAYFGGTHHGGKDSKGIWGYTGGLILKGFDKFQTLLEEIYGYVLKIGLKLPIAFIAIGIALSIYLFSFGGKVTKTFLPPQDSGEFAVSLEMKPGTSLSTMSEVALKVDDAMRKHPEVLTSILTVGGRDGESNVASYFVQLVPSKQRTKNTTQTKDAIRNDLQSQFAFAKPIVKDYDAIGGGMRPFTFNLIGKDLVELEKYATMIYEKLKVHPGLKDVELGIKEGKPEFQVDFDEQKAQSLGVASVMAGAELRTHVEGTVASVFRENGREFDIRVRLQEDQRNLKEFFNQTYIPNINGSLVRLSSIAKPVDTLGPVIINRQDRGRYIQISADVAADGPGLGAVIDDMKKMFDADIKLPNGMKYAFIGQAENFQELVPSMLTAMILGTCFIFFVLASLYESFVTPFTIMLVLPLAMSGAIYGLYITKSSLDIFSMIGCIMLLGIATKNSILLVDYANQKMGEGMAIKDAIVDAGKTRLRPILMTTIALVAGMLPIAIGMNEASKQRTSMGIAVVGGLISSTVLTLIIVPFCHYYIEKFRRWALADLQKKYSIIKITSFVVVSAIVITLFILAFVLQHPNFVFIKHNIMTGFGVIKR